MTGPVRFTVAAFFVVAFSYVSCSSTEHADTCATVCERYNACFDDTMDVSECTDDCVDDAADNDGFGTDVDGCRACMEAEGCGASLFDCFDECGAVFGQPIP